MSRTVREPAVFRNMEEGLSRPRRPTLERSGILKAHPGMRPEGSNKDRNGGHLQARKTTRLFSSSTTRTMPKTSWRAFHRHRNARATSYQITHSLRLANLRGLALHGIRTGQRTVARNIRADVVKPRTPTKICRDESFSCSRQRSRILKLRRSRQARRTCNRTKQAGNGKDFPPNTSNSLNSVWTSTMEACSEKTHPFGLMSRRDRPYHKDNLLPPCRRVLHTHNGIKGGTSSQRVAE